MNIKPLAVEKLYHACPVDALQCESITETDFSALGQSRALSAIEFAIGMHHPGFNLFVSGSTGIGKRQLVSKIVATEAASRQPPTDWCYVNNFEEPHTPCVLELPPGTGSTLRNDMLELVETLLVKIPAAFHSDEYRSQVQEVRDEFQQREQDNFKALGARAQKFNITLMRTPNGYTLSPMRDGKLLTPEDFHKLSKAEQQQIEQYIEQLNAELIALVRQVPQLQLESRERLRQLENEVTRAAIEPEINAVKQRYSEFAAVLAYLESVHQDLIENIDDFFIQEKSENPPPLHKLARSSQFRRYQINQLQGQHRESTAPVVYEDIPSYQNLIGRVEYSAHYGTLSTDFSLIQPGALHRSNGGYLVLDARKLLSFPFAWEGLKRALHNEEIRIDSLERMYGAVSTQSLEPQPIPLKVKVILMGDRHLYYLLKAYDPEFPTLFKVYADFAEQLDRDAKSIREYAGLVCCLAREEQLLPLQPQAVARVLEQSSRQVDDSLKLSLNRGQLVDLLREADFWSRQSQRSEISVDDVEQALLKQRYRNSQHAELMQQQIERGTVMIDTDGKAVGQGNALSVIQLGDQRFGHPSRITATARLGSGRVIDIEREIKLGGAIHSKGVMILAAFLANHYARSKPLSLNASLVFEQSYGRIDGDSASALELCTLLSAISGIPLKQSFAVTGSVNQHGQVQAIGGVNEKIEGFFDLCNSRGLNAEQGVIIPAANVIHLVLNRDVVNACKDGKFQIYAVNTIDELLSLLVDIEVGSMEADGLYPLNSFNGRVQRQLSEWCEIARKQDGGARDQT